MPNTLPTAVELLFDGIMEECSVEVRGNDIVCKTADGRFVKFPKDSDFDELVDSHNANEFNATEPEVVPEPEPAAEDEADDGKDSE